MTLFITIYQSRAIINNENICFIISETITGTGQINKETGRGILRGLSQCWCDYNQHCYCFDKYTIRSTTPSNAIHYGNQSLVGSNSGKDKNNTVTNVNVGPVLDGMSLFQLVVFTCTNK